MLGQQGRRRPREYGGILVSKLKVMRKVGNIKFTLNRGGGLLIIKYVYLFKHIFWITIQKKIIHGRVGSGLGLFIYLSKK